VSKLSDFGVAERKLSVVRSLLKDYISDENSLLFVNHRYPTRSKDGGAPLVSYFGQASTTVTGNKGSRKRAISDGEISSSSKQIRSSGTVNIARSPWPDEKKGVVKLVVPVSMIEDVIESKKVVESTSDALIEAQDQRPIEDNKASENLGPAVTMKDAIEIDEWFGCTTVPVNVNSSCKNLVAVDGCIWCIRYINNIIVVCCRVDDRRRRRNNSRCWNC
jgi:hypothetical protein